MLVCNSNVQNKLWVVTIRRSFSGKLSVVLSFLSGKCIIAWVIDRSIPFIFCLFLFAKLHKWSLSVIFNMCPRPDRIVHFTYYIHMEWNKQTSSTMFWEGMAVTLWLIHCCSPPVYFPFFILNVYARLSSIYFPFFILDVYARLSSIYFPFFILNVCALLSSIYFPFFILNVYALLSSIYFPFFICVFIPGYHFPFLIDVCPLRLVFPDWGLLSVAPES